MKNSGDCFFRNIESSFNTLIRLRNLNIKEKKTLI